MLKRQDILSHAGKISHETALDKARGEYEKYQRQAQMDELSLIEGHFLKSVEEIELIKSD